MSAASSVIIVAATNIGSTVAWRDSLMDPTQPRMWMDLDRGGIAGLVRNGREPHPVVDVVRGEKERE